MQAKRYTSTNIAKIIGNTHELHHSAKNSLHRRVGNLAQKHYLRDGLKIDDRGTLDFPFLEIFRAAIYCEFLALSMDIKVASTALEEAEKMRFAPGTYPASLRTEGGWHFDDGGLAAAVHGVDVGEEWLLVVEIKRSNESGGAGLAAQYIAIGHEQPNVDVILGRAVTATTLTINLKTLFAGLLDQLKDVS